MNKLLQTTSMLTLIQLTGCGVRGLDADRIYFPEPAIADTALVDVQNFLADCYMRECDLADWHKLEYVKSEPLTGQLAGVCTYHPDYRQISLSPEWYKPGTCSGKSLVYHELGHCVLNLEHTDSTQVDIMDPQMDSEYNCVTYWEESVERFFKSALDKAQSK
jgi:hypothetical protein